MLAYCDYIAKVVNDSLKRDSQNVGVSYVDSVGKINFDLGKNGEFLSTRKTMSVIDTSGKAYRVIIEEI
jgi:hypothetical protein